MPKKSPENSLSLLPKSGKNENISQTYDVSDHFYSKLKLI